MGCSVAICRLMNPRRVQGRKWLELCILELGRISVSDYCKTSQWGVGPLAA